MSAKAKRFILTNIVFVAVYINNEQADSVGAGLLIVTPTSPVSSRYTGERSV